MTVKSKELSGPAARRDHSLGPLGPIALAGLVVVCLAHWSDLYGAGLAAGTVAGVFSDPTRLAGAALWVGGWILGLV